MVDRTSEKEINEFNSQMQEWINLYYPGSKHSKEEEVQEMADTFEMLFRGSDGKPKSINMKVGESTPDIEIDNYLDQIRQK